MELIAAGRLAEVFALDEKRVVKLDRAEWNGVSAFESHVIARITDESVLPIPHSHGVVTIDGRCGLILDRIDGRSLRQVILESTETDADSLAERFCDLQARINATAVSGLPDLVTRLREEIRHSGLTPPIVGELTRLIERLDDGQRKLCHYDFHPENVIVTANGAWMIVDWLGAASGPPAADLARTLLLTSVGRPEIAGFARRVRYHVVRQEGFSEADCNDWIRIVAGARLAEGFSGDAASRLLRMAMGEVG